MARATRLRVTSERPFGGNPEPGSPQADALAAIVAESALKANGLGNGNGYSTPSAPSGENGEQILQYLQMQLSEKDHLLQQATSDLRSSEESRKTAEKAALEANSQIEGAYNEARSVIQKAQSEKADLLKQSEHKAGVITTIALGIVNKLFERFSAFIVFLFNRLPSLGALIGAYFLWDHYLSNPNWLHLIGLALFGSFVVLPTIWLARSTG